MKNYFSTHDTHHTPKFFLLLENVIILNYNKCSKLILTQKIEEPLSTSMSAYSEASMSYKFDCQSKSVVNRLCTL